jgi:murein DD-endopeptidase / murein LD-carboxypeptidase
MPKLIKSIILLLFLSLTGTAQERISADSLLSFAKTQLGVKYKYGSINPKVGFDCSGFVYYVFGHFKIKVPRASMDYEKVGKIISPDSCRAGDIIVFTGTNIKNRKPGHVGIVISNSGNELNFIHSSSGHKRVGVIITNFKDSPYYQSRFIKIVRLAVVR